MQGMWETVSLSVWLFDVCAEEQPRVFTHVWGYTAYSVQSGRLEAQSQHLWLASEGHNFHPPHLGD